MRLVQFRYYVFGLLVIALSQSVRASERTIKGLIIDRNRQIRLAQVFIKNQTAQRAYFSDYHGEFGFRVNDSDTLVVLHPGFYPDTIIVQPSQKTLIVYLFHDGETLPEVRVKATKNTAKNYFEARIKENATKIDKYEESKLLSVGPSGAGVGIDAIYNKFSREGKDVAQLQKIIQKEYQARVVDERFSKDLVSRVTKLKNAELDDFMQYFRPSFEYVMQNNLYEMIKYIKHSYATFRISPEVFKAPELRTD